MELTNYGTTMTTAEAEKIAEQVETMLMGVDIKPDTMTIEPNIVVSIQYNENCVTNYVISDLKGTCVVDGRSLNCKQLKIRIKIKQHSSTIEYNKQLTSWKVNWLIIRQDLCTFR